MAKLRFFGLAVLLVIFLSVPGILNALGPFSDDFGRADSKDVGNGWEEGEDAGISISIKSGEVLIQGTQDQDWERNGISRDVGDISSLSFDFLNNDNFNMHMRIDDTNTGAYIDVYCWPGGPFSHANSVDGGWPGWVEITGSQSLLDEYNTLGFEKTVAGSYQIMHNGVPIGDPLVNASLATVNRIQIAPDSAANTVGSVRIDNVIIDGGAAAVEASDKLSTTWGAIRSSF